MVYPEAFKRRFTGMGTQTRCPRRIDAKQHEPFNHILNANASTRRSQTFKLCKTLKNVELKTLCIPGSAAQVYLNVSQYIVSIKESNISVAWVCPN